MCFYIFVLASMYSVERCDVLCCIVCAFIHKSVPMGSSAPHIYKNTLTRTHIYAYAMAMAFNETRFKCKRTLIEVASTTGIHAGNKDDDHHRICMIY